MTGLVNFEIEPINNLERMIAGGEGSWLAEEITQKLIINRIRDDGAIDAYVPLGEIDTGNVPIDPGNLKIVKDLLEERSRETGGTGQRDPVVIGYVQREGLFLLDGYHRYAAQEERGIDKLHATVELMPRFDDVVKRRLEYARTHKKIAFARQVGWIQELWDRTDWSEQIPNVISAFRACRDDYAFDRSEDVALIDSLSDKDFSSVRNWLREHCDEWSLGINDFFEELKTVEGISSNLVPLIFSQAGKVPPGRIGRSSAEAVVEVYPGEYDIQEAVVKRIIDHKLSKDQVKTFLDYLENNTPLSAEDVDRLSAAIDFNRLSTAKKFQTNHRRNRISQQRMETMNAIDVVQMLRHIISELHDASVSNTLTDGDLDNIKAVYAGLGAIILRNSEDDDLVDRADKKHLHQAEYSCGKSAITDDSSREKLDTPDDLKLTDTQKAMAVENLNLVDKLVRHDFRRQMIMFGYADLYGAGVEGLVSSVMSYQPDKSIEFAAFARHRIRGAILDYMRSMDFASRSLRKVEREISSARGDFEAKNKRSPHMAELAQALDIHPSKLNKIFGEIEASNPISIHTTMTTHDEEISLVDIIEDVKALDPEELVDESETRLELKVAISRLSAKKRSVIESYFFRGYTLLEIAEDQGLTESRISQILSSALRDLKALLPGSL